MKPKWCERGPAPLAAAIAAATHHAWLQPAEGRSHAFLGAFRQLVGHEDADRHELRALTLFQLQPEPPVGYDPPPAGSFMAICPRCRVISRTPHTRPYGGRIKLQVLRDPEWLHAQFERGATLTSIAARLGCEITNVGYWCQKHGIQSPKEANARELEERVRALHIQGRGPGGIARELEMTTHYTRQVMQRMGLANLKTGHVYFAREWWVEKMRVLGWTKARCAKEAGITQHAATYYVKRFGLSDLTAKNARRKGARFPMLVDPRSLAELLRRHDDNYESVAREVGCAPSLVSRYARKILGRAKKLDADAPHCQRGWWEERIDRGMIVPEMAEEAGIAEKSAVEKLRVMGLLDRAYANELARERKRRSA